jgi:hypothetical protein
MDGSFLSLRWISLEMAGVPNGSYYMYPPPTLSISLPLLTQVVLKVILKPFAHKEADIVTSGGALIIILGRTTTFTSHVVLQSCIAYD